MKILISTLLILMTSSFAKRDDRTCQERYRDVRSACMGTESACHNLHKCQTIRNQCPQNHETVGGCEEFKQCVVEEAAQQQQSCIYKWSGNPNTGQCYLRNLPEESFSKRCPGVNSLIAALNDSEYNCEGHKDHYRSRVSKCESERNSYMALCHNSTLDIDTFQVHSCAAIESNVVLNETDIPSQVVADSPRERGFAQKLMDGLNASFGSTLNQSQDAQSR